MVWGQRGPELPALPGATQLTRCRPGQKCWLPEGLPAQWGTLPGSGLVLGLQLCQPCGLAGKSQALRFTCEET